MSFDPSQPGRVRVCGDCGLLTPADELRCRECGAPAREYVEEREAVRFARAVFLRESPFAHVFFGLNILIFGLMALAGGSTSEGVLRAFGAKDNALISAGEYWRFITANFLHIGLIHLFVNSYALWSLGRQIESLYGSARFVVLYVVSGVACCLASFWFSPYPAAGASGSLFGLFGALAVFTYKYRAEIPARLHRSITTQVLLLIGLNALITFGIPNISVSGHLGGFASGIALGTVIPYARPGERKTGPAWIVGQVVCLVLIAVSFGLTAWKYNGPPLGLSNVRFGSNLGIDFDPDEVNAYIDAVNGAEETFKTIFKQRLNADPGLFAELKARNARSLEALEKAPNFDPGADALRKQMAGLLREQAAWIDAGDPKQRELLETKYREYLDAQRRWIETDGKKYGLTAGEDSGG